MNNKSLLKLIIQISLTFILILFAFALFNKVAKEVEASSVEITYVDDDSCPNMGSGTTLDPYCSIQYAVDAVTSGEIHIAEGLYSGTQVISTTNTYTYTQVIFIDKDVILRGGFDATDWEAPPDPYNQSSTIDAERNGRGITILGSGSETVIIDGLTVTGGDYSGLGNPEGVSGEKCKARGLDCGGGLFAYGVKLDLINSIIEDNFASTPASNRDSYGGGIYLWNTRPGTSIVNTAVISNTVSGGIGYGGGLGADGTMDITINGSRFQDNHATHEGGGMYIFQPDGPLTITGSFFNNNVSKYGGSAIKANVTDSGEALQIDRVQMANNRSDRHGTALYIEQQGSSSVTARLSNLIFNGNSANNPDLNSTANVLKITHTKVFDVFLEHITASDNPSGTFLVAESDDDEGDSLTVAVNNSLINSFTNVFSGLQRGNGILQIDYNRTLFENVTNIQVTAGGAVTFNESESIFGSAKLDPTYHLLSDSDAIDAGFISQITHDFDDDARSDEEPDIGADEYRSRIYIPIIFQAAQ